MLRTFDYKNAVTGASESIQLMDSVASILYYKKVFGTSMVDDFKNAEKDSDILVIYKAAYAMAYPSLIGKESFEQFCARFSFSDLGGLTETVSEVLASMAPKEEKGKN